MCNFPVVSARSSRGPKLGSRLPQDNGSCQNPNLSTHPPKGIQNNGESKQHSHGPPPHPTISMTRTPFTFQSWPFQDSFSKHLIGPFLFILFFLESLFRGELRFCVISLLFYCFVLLVFGHSNMGMLDHRCLSFYKMFAYVVVLGLRCST